MGRTGVFIALDHLIQHVRDHDFVDIYGLVAELRSERMCMVQNLVSSHLKICGVSSPDRGCALCIKAESLLQKPRVLCPSAACHPLSLLPAFPVHLSSYHCLKKQKIPQNIFIYI